MKIPFDRETFSEMIKKNLSGANVTLSFDNVASSLVKKSIDFSKMIGNDVYETICSWFSTPQEDEIKNRILSYLQKSMLNFAIGEHLIFLITRIGNDGVTVKKNDDETTIYKYQQDQLNNTLINLGWFWYDTLITCMNDNISNFPEWDISQERKSLCELPVQINDFNRWLGIGNYYFISKTQWIIREVWNDCIKARFKEGVPEKYMSDVVRAVCYRVMSLSCIRLPYSDLPENIRMDIDNEQSKSLKNEENTRIRERLSKQFDEKSSRYFGAIDMKIASDKDQNNYSKEIYKSGPLSDSDKFIIS